jgi:hypothetical protein
VAAPIARVRSRAVFAVQGLGKNSRSRGFADAPHAGKKIGVGYATGPDSVLQSEGNVPLPGNVVKGLRAPLTRQNEIRHTVISNCKSQIAKLKSEI